MMDDDDGVEIDGIVIELCVVLLIMFKICV